MTGRSKLKGPNRLWKSGHRRHERQDCVQRRDACLASERVVIAPQVFGLGAFGTTYKIELLHQDYDTIARVKCFSNKLFSHNPRLHVRVST